MVEGSKKTPSLSVYLLLLIAIMIYGVLLWVIPPLYIFSSLPLSYIFFALPVLSILLLFVLIPLTLKAWRELGKEHGWGIIIGSTIIWWLSLIAYTVWAAFFVFLKAIVH
ncbi:hypothetical protein [Thermoflavimicrobium dichotomicum]|uniref:Uncharacterized protein n=1 Tax=Thermoflavimicrobium dichotomicum TaxID=46223 RepID=A0A1I3VCW1_9BACL|nr:hypothetical protein [Thermoflavimicrobium dichotomicum]SFJ91971.1 hypothetical protein SAMN05421852_1397 [Thermoflavimicrobium dichotomicum]